jgi:hypothetical protein
MKEDLKAYEMFSHAFKLDPTLVTSPICLKLVNCLSGMMRIEEALSVVNDYLKLNPNNA